MGGGSSKPRGPPPPTIVEQAPPAGSGEGSVLYPNKPDTPRLDGITRAIANECNGCRLQLLTGTSSSSVKMTREYGLVSFAQCRKYAEDKKRVQNKEFSLQDFLNNLQAGRYYRDLNNGFCEQVELSSEDAMKVTTVDQYNEGVLRSVRIQKMASGGFSSDTKAKITPSIPFQLRFSAGGGAPTDISVKTMTLYHPCPLRLEGVQPDAVLSLNDPSFDNPGYVVLIPLVGANTPAPSAKFLEKILPQVVAVSEPDPSTGQYLTKDIPTGANWTLNNVFATTAGTDQTLEVTNGYYEWKGMPTLERVREQSGNTITYAWKESGTPPPRYIMLDTAVVCNPSDLAILTQRMPVTPASDAIHAVLYSSNPLQRGIVHKQGPAVNCEVKEGFGTRGITEESCDPWKTWAQTADGNGYSTQQIFRLMFNVMVALAMAVGAFLALIAVLRMYDVEYKDFAEGMGKVTAVFFKSIKEKVGKVKSLVGNAKGLAKGSPSELMSSEEGTAPGSVLSNVAGISSPFAPLASLPETPSTLRKTRRATKIPLDQRLVGPSSIPVPTSSVPFANVLSSASEVGVPPPIEPLPMRVPETKKTTRRTIPQSTKSFVPTPQSQSELLGRNIVRGGKD